MVVLAIRLMSMFACSFGGYRIAVLLNDNYIRKDPQQVLALIIGIILGLLVGYVLGGMVGRYLAGLWVRTESTFSRVTGADLFLGAMGTLLGLLVALLPSLALFRLGWGGLIASIALFMVCGFAGMRIGVVKRTELSTMFKLGQGAAGASAMRTAYVLDTSVIIDGRVVEVARTGFMEGTMVVPGFVLKELQGVADSSDTLKRNRGRRGLDVLNALQHMDNLIVEITDQDFPELSAVDGKLIALSRATGLPLITNDFNLNRVAEIQGVKVLNVNELASALKPVVLPGEEMKVKIIREGKEPGQGVGYLDDGTMVVVQRGKHSVGSLVQVVATSVLQTPAGKMIFTELLEEGRED